MIKKIAAMVVALAMVLVPAASMASTTHQLTFKDDQIKITVPQDVNMREGITADYTGTANTDLKMTQIFLIYEKGAYYVNLDYITDNGGKDYKMDNEEDALKMYEDMGFKILQEDVVSSGKATTGEFEDPEFFMADNGIGYIKQKIRADGSDVVNMIVYITCTDVGLYKTFISYGSLNKETELFEEVSEESQQVIEEIIGTYSDSGYDMAYLKGDTKESPFHKAGRYAIIGFVVGIIFFMVYFFAKQKGKQRRGKKSVFDKEEEIVVRSVKDSYADRGKNPNAKKGKNHNKK